MSTVTLKGNPIHTTERTFPAPGSKASAFTLVKADLSEIPLADLAGRKVLLNIFPSLDTPVCATSIRRFNQEAASIPNTVILCISMDLPFAGARFCAAEGIEKVHTASAFRSPEFGEEYGVLLVDGPLRGLFARAVFVLDETGTVTYAQLVPEITQEPDYEAALKALK
ncbi:MAG: thiol peroxidase [Kiritimatiellae bacterium]|nr:thiol peroxidase [Kiritimatiellia bacterium]MDD4734962.1 thiol peroxidase [Kiritimatiellia bacterium]